MKFLFGIPIILTVFSALTLKAQEHGTSYVYCAADVPGTLLGTAYAPSGATSYSWVVHGGVITDGQGTSCIHFTGSGGWTTVIVTITSSTGTRTESCNIYLQDTGGGPGEGKRLFSSAYPTVEEVLTLLAEVKHEPFKVAIDGVDLLGAMTDQDLSNRRVAYITDELHVVTLVLDEGSREREIITDFER